MVNVSAARQVQVVYWCVAALLLTAAAIFAIAGDASWPQWLILSSAILSLASSWIHSVKPKASKFIINFLAVVAVALSVTGVISLLAARHWHLLTR